MVQRSSHLSPARSGPRRGFAAIYMLVMFVALLGVVSFSVDYGRVQLAKMQLQTAADAAARAAAANLPRGVAAVQDAAVAVAGANTCDGTPVALDSANDVEFGRWDASAGSFTVLTGAGRSSANAVRITARRTAARGNAVALVFASTVGRNTCDVKAQAIAATRTTPMSGFIGLSGLTMKNSAFWGGYDSRVTKNPKHASGGTCLIGSNGPIDVKSNGEVKGDVQYGPAGSVDSGLSVSGSKTRLDSPIPPPALPSWSPGVNPGGVPQNYTVNSDRVLPGGTYWFTSLTINADLSFSGPATVYVNGDVVVNANLTASGSIPSNLTLYQLGTSRTFGDSGGNHMDITARIIAPGSDLVAKNAMVLRGSATFNSMTLKDTGDLYYDAADGPAAGGTVVWFAK